jgi:hypothetical protein
MSKHLRPYLQPAFLVCVLLLLTSAATKSLVIRFLGVQLVKFPLDLKQNLNEIDEKALSSYSVHKKLKIDNPDIIETLGTEDYMQWIIVDTDAAPDSPVRYCSIFVTYYTGNPDMVPHVPDECYAGGGNTRMAGYVDSAVLRLDNGQTQQKIEYQNILFGNNDPILASDIQYYVSYLFHANGKYSGSRTETRKILGQNFFSKYSYFSKVEWKFYGIDAFGHIYPDRQQVVQASEKLLQILLPVLERNHWPDWDAANRNLK